jgi:hypothetical protein
MSQLIKLAFRRCGFVPFQPHQVLRLMPVNECLPEPEPESEPESENDLPM